MNKELHIATAATHLQSVLTEAFHHSPSDNKRTLLIYDEDSALAEILTAAYISIAPNLTKINFNPANTQSIINEFKTLSPGDLVILVQSTSFRLDEFRIRIHLFSLGLKVIEHPHLQRIREEEFGTYIGALAYDRDYYHRVGPDLKNRIDRCQEVVVAHQQHRLVYGGPLEPAMLNIGDYRKTKNVGGQFPIGEVFTELKDLAHLNGQVDLFAFGNKDFTVFHTDTPITLEIKNGKIVDIHGTLPEFDTVLNDIRRDEGGLWVRELGFGLNRAMTRLNLIRDDVGTYERMCGIHLSLGGKHTIYAKEGFPKKKFRYHVDVFAAVDDVTIDKEIVFKNGSYCL